MLDEPPDAAAEIAGALADLTAELLGKQREPTAVAVGQVAPERWFIGGEALTGQGLASFYLDIEVTEGANTKNERARYVEQVFAAMEGIPRTLAPGSYVVIH